MVISQACSDWKGLQGAEMTGFRVVSATLVFTAAFAAGGCGGGGQPDVTVGDDVVVGTECISSSQCDDGLPCTVDRCSRGFCSNQELDCDDGDDCTTDSCVGGACRNERLAGCCETDADCDDGDPCTKNDRCSIAKQCIVNAPISPCCRNDADCDDGDVCTEDSCGASLLCNHIWREQIGTCCNEAKDCADSDSCTLDRCVMSDAIHGRCDHETICCDLDSDCTEGESTCMEGVCEVPSGGSRKECSYAWSDGCCIVVDDCEQFDCRVASCADNECGWDRIPGCCTSDADCPDTKGCLTCNNGDAATGACVLRGIEGCCKTEVFSENFTSGSGWLFQSPSDYMADASGYSDDAAWAWSGTKGYGAAGAIVFSDPSTGSCRIDGFKSGGRAVSPSIPLMMTNGPGLSFMMWKYTDDIVSTKDVVSVYVKAGAGDLHKVFSTSSHAVFVTGDSLEGTSFKRFPATGLIDLSEWSGQNVELVFEYDSASPVFVEDYGVYLDDVVVSGTCN